MRPPQPPGTISLTTARESTPAVTAAATQRRRTPLLPPPVPMAVANHMLVQLAGRPMALPVAIRIKRVAARRRVVVSTRRHLPLRPRLPRRRAPRAVPRPRTTMLRPRATCAATATVRRSAHTCIARPNLPISSLLLTRTWPICFQCSFPPSCPLYAVAGHWIYDCPGDDASADAASAFTPHTGSQEPVESSHDSASDSSDEELDSSAPRHSAAARGGRPNARGGGGRRSPDSRGSRSPDSRGSKSPDARGKKPFHANGRRSPDASGHRHPRVRTFKPVEESRECALGNACPSAAAGDGECTKEHPAACADGDACDNPHCNFMHSVPRVQLCKFDSDCKMADCERRHSAERRICEYVSSVYLSVYVCMCMCVCVCEYRGCACLVLLQLSRAFVCSLPCTP